jgi:hypothetical protein
MLADDRINSFAVLTLGRFNRKTLFLRRVPERNPRTLWACQSVAAISSCKVAPPFRRSSARIPAFLLPSRAREASSPWPAGLGFHAFFEATRGGCSPTFGFRF